jgi:hypothetical protein
MAETCPCCHKPEDDCPFVIAHKTGKKVCRMSEAIRGCCTGISDPYKLCPGCYAPWWEAHLDAMAHIGFQPNSRLRSLE